MNDLAVWLQDNSVRSWFDLGLLLDGLSDHRSDTPMSGESKDLPGDLARGIALISFEGPGESQRDEISRYAEIFESLLEDASEVPAIWWVDEAFTGESDTLSASRWRDADPTEGGGHVWDGYSEIFETRLDRGSGAYNALIGKIWSQTCALAPKLADFVERQDIRLLVPVNVCSTPSHVSLALAIVLVSEQLGVPVLNINRDFWWEDPAYHAEQGSMPDSRGQFFANAHLGEVFSLVEVLFPWYSPLWVHGCGSAAQRDRLIADFGFNPASIAVTGAAATSAPAIGRLLEVLALGLSPDQQSERRARSRAAFALHRQVTRYDADFANVALTRNREYMPGLNKLEYLSTLKSLIDPSAFRMEEKALRGRVFQATERILQRCAATAEQQSTVLLNADDLFAYFEGEDELVVDHSLSYRHRQKRHYPWRKLTEPELMGVVSALVEKLVPPPATVDSNASTLGSDGESLPQIANAAGYGLGIDHSAALDEALRQQRPIAWLPGEDWQQEATGWVAGVLRQRLGLDELADPDAAAVAAAAESIEDPSMLAITLFASHHHGRAEPQADHALQWMKGASALLAACLDAGLLRVVTTDGLSAGTHLAQLGPAAAELTTIRDAGGVAVAVGIANAYTLDTLDMLSFRIACCDAQPFASFMGLKPGQGFVLQVPAGLRPSLAYPTPIQTPLEFAQALGSRLFAQARQKMGETALLGLLREDADSNGTPVAETLERLLGAGSAEENPHLTHNLLTGVHDNGDPWSGATARLSGVREGRWSFNASFAERSSDTVLALIEQFRRGGGGQVDVAWNGGFILNPELVGKLGLPEDYIGTPLGLLIDQGRVLAPPLFNKPAMAFLTDGSIALREANCGKGLQVTGPDGVMYEFLASHYNRATAEAPAVFDLMHAADEIDGKGRRIFRLAGDQVLEVVDTSGPVTLLPVGLTLAFPLPTAPDWQSGDRIRYALPGWEGVDNAIEAGPMLIRDGRISVEMQEGGWTLPTSICTQAARIDYLHMRGPKIGVGLTESGDLVIAAINGRLRESVGATHAELARILLDLGAVNGMGFDPGGSVTLVVQGRQLNISPYNKDYLSSPYSLPPQPRFVGNAILASAS